MRGKNLLRGLSALVYLVVVLEEHEVDSHVAIEGTELVNELLLVDVIVYINAVYQLEESTEVCGL